MLIVSPSTASALAMHAAQKSWVMFVQVNQGPIKIEGVKGTRLGARLDTLARENAFDPMLIGLIESATPDADARVLLDQLAPTILHHDWVAPSNELLLYIQQAAQPALQELLSVTHPGGFSEEPVDIEQIAQILGVSVPTIRRMIDRKAIPFLRVGRNYRFVPADVLATMASHTR